MEARHHNLSDHLQEPSTDDPLQATVRRYRPYQSVAAAPGSLSYRLMGHSWPVLDERKERKLVSRDRDADSDSSRRASLPSALAEVIAALQTEPMLPVFPTSASTSVAATSTPSAIMAQSLAAPPIPSASASASSSVPVTSATFDADAERESKTEAASASSPAIDRDGSTTATSADNKPRADVDDGCDCPICQQPMRAPLNNYCGHNVCQACLAAGQLQSCPVCRVPTNASLYYPNYNMAKAIDRLHHAGVHRYEPYDVVDASASSAELMASRADARFALLLNRLHRALMTDISRASNAGQFELTIKNKDLAAVERFFPHLVRKLNGDGYHFMQFEVLRNTRRAIVSWRHFSTLQFRLR